MVEELASSIFRVEVNMLYIAQHLILEDYNFHSGCHESLKSRMIFVILNVNMYARMLKFHDIFNTILLLKVFTFYF